jgi:hypothetical protein
MKVQAAHKAKGEKEEVPQAMHGEALSFYPFVVSIDGLIGKELKIFLEKLSALLTETWKKLHTPKYAASSMPG